MGLCALLEAQQKTHSLGNVGKDGITVSALLRYYRQLKWPSVQLGQVTGHTNYCRPSGTPTSMPALLHIREGKAFEKSYSAVLAQQFSSKHQAFYTMTYMTLRAQDEILPLQKKRV